MHSYRGVMLPEDVIADEVFYQGNDVIANRILGAMRTAGIFQRVHTTSLAERVTILRFSTMNAVSNDVCKALCLDFATVVYGLEGATFFQSDQEVKQSRSDRMYFHAVCTHKA